MVEENISQGFILKNIDETRNCFVEEIEQTELISKKYKKVYKTLNYIKYFLILASTVTGYLSTSAFASFCDIPRGTTSTTIGLQFFAITLGIKM